MPDKSAVAFALAIISGTVDVGGDLLVGHQGNGTINMTGGTLSVTGKTWDEFARGTTIGYKRLLRFDDVSARKVRLKILNSRICPTISNFALFYAPPIETIIHN